MKIYAEDLNGVMTDALKHFELLPRSQIWEAERIVLWNDYTSAMKDLIMQAKDRGIPTIMVQHGPGVGWPDGWYDEYRHYDAVPIADRICLCGTKDVEEYLRLGADPKTVFLTGTAIMWRLRKISHEQFTVCYAPKHDANTESNPDLAGPNHELARQLKESGYRSITKLVAGEHFVGFYDQPIIISDRVNRQEEHLEACAKALEEVDVVLSYENCAFELMAAYLKIPVVSRVEDIANAKFVESNILQERAQSEDAVQKIIDVIEQ